MSRLAAPPAALTVIAATVQDHPNVEPRRLAELIARELGREGWAIGVPTGRATTEAAEPLRLAVRESFEANPIGRERPRGVEKGQKRPSGRLAP